MVSFSRRGFCIGAGAAAASCAVKPLFGQIAWQSQFKVGVIADEISQDFEHACSVIANDFGLHYVELREMWGKNLQVSTDDQLAEAERIIAKYKLTVTDIGSPLFKADWPGAPRSKHSPTHDTHGAPDMTMQQQDGVLAKSIELAKRFKTNKVRCFDFWRLEDQTPFRAAIDEKLREAAGVAGKQGILLVLENEPGCNTATGREAARTLAAVQTPHLALNWDAGNAVMAGEMDAFPGGWDTLPKDRIHHCHVKNAVKNGTDKAQWSPVDVGIIDWVGQFKALEKVGYHDAVNLETHWHGGGTPEQSTRTSWAGMKKCLDASSMA